MAFANNSEIVTLVVALLNAETEFEFGDGQAPGPKQLPLTAPYGVVHEIADGTAFQSSRVFTQPDMVANLIIQVDAVGERRDQAGLLAHKAKQVLIGRTPSTWTYRIEGATSKVIDRRQNSGSGVRLDGNLWQSQQRYQLTVVPHNQPF